MSSRKIKLKAPGTIEPCPKCHNRTEFTVHSNQVCEDGCEIYAECKCGYKPKDAYIEDVWGGTSDEQCIIAISAWADGIEIFNDPKIES